GVAALAATGIPVSDLVVNRVTPGADAPCGLCEGRRREEASVVASTRRAFPGQPLRILPAFDEEPRGATALRALGRRLKAGAPGQRTAGDRGPRGRGRASGWSVPPGFAVRPPDLWLERIAPVGVRLVAFAGKGGVGKTTCAAAAAVALARRRADA